MTSKESTADRDVDPHLLSSDDERGQPVPDSAEPDPTVFVAHRGGVELDAPGDRRAMVDDAIQLIQSCEAELAESAGEEPRCSRLHYEIARLQESLLDTPQEALVHYQAALDGLPDHLPSIRGARRIQLAEGKGRLALSLFDAEVRLTPDIRQRAALLYAKGRVLEDVLGRIDDARDLYGAAAQLCEGDPSFLKALEQLYAGDQSWDALGRTYEREAAAVREDTRHRAVLLAARARLTEVHHHDIGTATELYARAIDLDVNTTTAMEALRRLHHRRGEWRELVSVLQRQLETVEDDPDTRRLLFYRLARIQSEHLGNPQEAIAALRLATSLPPPSPLVLGELARLLEASGDIQGQAETLLQMAGCTTERRERVGILHRAGLLYADRLDDPGAAIEALQQALDDDPTYVPALRGLAPLYARRQQWTELARMHLREAEAVTETKRRAAAHVRAALILEERLGRIKDAARLHEQALTLVPDLTPSFKALVRIYRNEGRYRDLAGLYQRAVDVSREDERAIAYLFAIGELYEGPLGTPAEALVAYRAILARRPDHLGAIHAFQRAAESAGRYRELVEMLDREAELGDDDGQLVAILHRTAEILEEQLADRDGALARYRRVLTIDPEHAATLASLGRLYHAAGRWEDLADIYTRELEAAPDDPGAASLCYKLGEVCEKNIGDEKRAKIHYRRVLELDAAHGPALQALSRILQLECAWNELVQILRLAGRCCKDPRTRALTAFRVGELYEERLGQIDEAVDAHQEALALLPNYRPALEALERLRSDREYWSELAESLEQEAGDAPPRRACVLLLRAGETWNDHLNQPVRAIACYEAALAHDPENLIASLALEPLYRRTKAWQSLVDLYEQQCRLLVDPRAKVAVLRERARILALHEIGDESTLIDTCTSILGLEPDAPDVLAVLEQLALRSGDPRVLASVDGRIAGSTRDSGLIGAHLTRMAESLETAGNPNALGVYRKALASDPESRAAMRGLIRMGELLGDSDAVAEACRREAEVTKSPSLKADLRVRAARARLEGLHDREGAVEDLIHALDVWPDHAQAAELLVECMRTLGRYEQLATVLAHTAVAAGLPDRIAELTQELAQLHADRDDLTGAVSVLRRITTAHPTNLPARTELARVLARNGQWQECVQTLEQAVGHDLGEQRREVHFLLALARMNLGDAKGAYRSFDIVLEEHPDDREALTHVAQLQASEGSVVAAINTAKRLLETAGSDREQVGALLLLAGLEKGRNDHAKALDYMGQAIALEGPAGVSAATFLETAQEPTHWQRYVDALVDRLKKKPPVDDAVATIVEIARVQTEKLGDADAGIATLGKAAKRLENPNLRLELAARLRQAGRGTEAAAELQRLLLADATRVEAWRHLAHTFEELGQPQRVALAVAPLAVLGAITPAEQALLRRQPPRPASAGSGSFAKASLLPLGASNLLSHPIAPLLTLATEGLGKLRPDPLALHGLTSRDKLGARSGHPTVGLVERVAAVFGVTDYQVYELTGPTTRVELEVVGDEPAFLLPVSLARLPTSQQVFAVARPMGALVFDVPIVEILESDEIALLLAAAAHAADPNRGTDVASAAVLSERYKLVTKGLSRRSRRAFEEGAATYASAEPLDVRQWVEAVRQTCRRAAAVLSDDIAGAVELTRTQQGLGDVRDMALVRSSAAIRDLLATWVAPVTMRFREANGMLPAAG